MPVGRYRPPSIVSSPDELAKELDRAGGETPALSEAMTVSVPTRPNESARILAGLDGALEYAVRKPKDGEAPTGYAIATRYHDTRHARKPKAVRGDGRAGIVGVYLARTARGGVAVKEIQAKGELDTGLKRVGAQDGEMHATGKERLGVALMEAILSDFLHDNAIEASGWLAVIDTQNTFSFYVDGHPEAPLYDFAGQLIRTGDLFRVAHFLFFENDPKRLKDLFDVTNHRLSVSLGRSALLTPDGLFKELATQKARRVADLFWLRGMHGSPTIDNDGIREEIDLGNMAFLDRTHATYTPTPVSPGFSLEPQKILHQHYAERFRGLFSKAYGESFSLDRKEADRILYGAFEQQMARQMLRHLGLDPDDAEAVWHHQKREVLALLDAFRRTSGYVETDVPYAMGADKDIAVAEPASYDTFAALSHLIRAAASGAPEAEQIDDVVRALSPLVYREREDRAEAKALLDRVRPIAAFVVDRRTPKPAAAEKVRMIAEEAVRLNEPLDAMNVYGRADRWMRRFVKGEPRQRIEAEINAFVREHRRTGPTSPPEVAMRLRHGDIERTEDGLAVLARIEENGLSIAELSSGVEDRLRFELEGDPLGLGDPSRYLLHLRIDGGAWQTLSPSPAAAIFDAALVGRAQRIEAYLSDRDQPDRKIDNAGFNYGKGHRLVSSSALVDAELAAFARREGKTRTSTSRAARLAVMHGGTRPAKGPGNVSPAVRAIQTVEDARSAPLEKAAAGPKATARKPPGPVTWEPPIVRRTQGQVDFFRLYGEERAAIDATGVTPDRPGVEAHAAWARLVGEEAAKGELERWLAILVHHPSMQDQKKRADFYADFAVRQLRHQVHLGGVTRNRPDRAEHAAWAESAGADAILAELAARVDALYARRGEANP